MRAPDGLTAEKAPSSKNLRIQLGRCVFVLMILAVGWRPADTRNCAEKWPKRAPSKWIMAGLATPRNHCQHLLKRLMNTWICWPTSVFIGSFIDFRGSITA